MARKVEIKLKHLNALFKAGCDHALTEQAFALPVNVRLAEALDAAEDIILANA